MDTDKEIRESTIALTIIQYFIYTLFLILHLGNTSSAVIVLVGTSIFCPMIQVSRPLFVNTLNHIDIGAKKIKILHDFRLIYGLTRKIIIYYASPSASKKSVLIERSYILPLSSIAIVKNWRILSHSSEIIFSIDSAFNSSKLKADAKGIFSDYIVWQSVEIRLKCPS